ncbi:MAG: leucyl aminopeptidase [bacterium]|nr:leucyl aminopeptidase [bacterium]
MRIRVTTRDLSVLKVDLAVCFAAEGDRRPRGLADAAVLRSLGNRMKSEGFRGRAGDRLIWNPDGGAGPGRYLIVGLGKHPGAPGEALRRATLAATRDAADFIAGRIAIGLPEISGQSTLECARAVIEGARAGAYQFDRHLTDDSRRRTPVTALTLAVPEATAGAARKAVRHGEITSDATDLARDLVNEAPSRLTPSVFARQATKVARASGLQCKVLAQADLRRLGMSALLEVSRGTRQPPRVVHLKYVPKGRARRQRIVLVGKGVTFDSGGLNLKPGDSMTYMKADMAGAAAVLAAMSALRDAGCRAEVHGLLGLVENLTGGDAYKPGDILDTYAGKTVEVGNTDAEGRLVLCDLLAWAAAKLKPTAMVDVATLTGACVVALGPAASGLFTRHDEMRDALAAAAAASGEKLWPMPMYEEYLQLLQKGPADLCNIGGRWGGAITAALFLGEFVPRELPWAHLDIAGPAFNDTEFGGMPGAATGAAAPTLIRWLESV